MKILKVVALAVVFAVLVVAGLGLQVMQGIERSVLRPQFYLDIFKQHDFFAVPQRAAAGMLARVSEQELPERVRQVLAQGLAAAASPAWVEEQTRYVVTGLLEFVKGRRAGLDLVIDLRERKEVFADTVAEELKRLAPAEQLKVVPPEVLQSLSRSVPRQELARAGIPVEVFRELAREFVKSANIPDRIDLASPGSIPPQAWENMARAQTAWKYGSIAPWAALLVLGGICLLLAGVGGGLKWVGSSMIVGGVVLFAGMYMAEGFVVEALARGTEAPEEIAAVLGINLVELALDVKDRVFAAVRGVSLAYAGAGVALAVLGMLAGRLAGGKKRPDQGEQGKPPGDLWR